MSTIEKDWKVFMLSLVKPAIAILVLVVVAVGVAAWINWNRIRRAMEGGTPRRGARDSRPLDGRRKVIE